MQTHKRISDTTEGYEKCPKWLKEAYRRSVKFICSGCHKHEETIGTLTPHRIRRGYQGGLYTPNNILMLCANCHKLRHSKEFK